ncbi:hypothetical protein [Pseudomonas synxantha]|uniref:hypothetical protein n=1 Tax=Pseudomonas synxantha TaxID=47883 RepID=UPI000F56E8DE|nr:hypothetical protein [Pseudomonas synxantha]
MKLAKPRLASDWAWAYQLLTPDDACADLVMIRIFHSNLFNSNNPFNRKRTGHPPRTSFGVIRLDPSSRPSFSAASLLQGLAKKNRGK